MGKFSEAELSESSPGSTLDKYFFCVLSLSERKAFIADALDRSYNLYLIAIAYLRHKVGLHRDNHNVTPLGLSHLLPQLLKEGRLTHIEVRLLGDVVHVRVGVDIPEAHLDGDDNLYCHTTCG